MANQPVESQELSDRYLNIRGNPAMLRAMARLKKGRGIAPRRLPTSPTVTDKLLTMERFLATQMTEQGFEQVFLGGKPDIEPNLERFQELERGAEALAMMMRRFEGRTWRGIHHHLTLAALATMRTLYC